MSLEEKKKVLSIYPDAVYFVGDKPPIGQRVVVRELGVGIVIGEVQPERTIYRLDHCSTCTCKSEPWGQGWWRVEMIGRKDFHGNTVVAIEYPPGLFPTYRGNTIKGTLVLGDYDIRNPPIPIRNDDRPIVELGQSSIK